MKLNEIFSTRQRISILEAIIYSNQTLSVNALANRLKLSKGFVSKYFEILIKEDILEKSNNKFKLKDNFIVKGIKVLLNIKRVDIRLFKKLKFIEAVGLYGSCAKGENFEDSDMDLWIKLKGADEQKLAHLTSILNKNIMNVKILYLTNEKLKQCKNEDPPFYSSLHFGSILVYGKKDAI